MKTNKEMLVETCSDEVQSHLEDWASVTHQQIIERAEQIKHDDKPIENADLICSIKNT